MPASKRAHIEREDRGVLQHFGHFALDDAARQPFGNRRLADAGIADIERIVLRAAAQDLNGAVDLGLAADQRIDLALRLSFEIDAIGVERVVALLERLLGAAHRPRRRWTRRASVRPGALAMPCEM